MVWVKYGQIIQMFQPVSLQIVLSGYTNHGTGWIVRCHRLGCGCHMGSPGRCQLIHTECPHQTRRWPLLDPKPFCGKSQGWGVSWLNRRLKPDVSHHPISEIEKNWAHVEDSTDSMAVGVHKWALNCRKDLNHLNLSLSFR